MVSLSNPFSSSRTRTSASGAAKNVVRNVAWLGAVVFGVAIALGYISIQVNPLVGGLAFAAMAGMAYALTEHDDSVSITFALTVVAVGLVILEYLAPGWIVEALPLGGLLEVFDPLEFAVLAGAVILTWWVIDIRFIQRSGVKAETVAKRLSALIQALVREWVSMARVAFLLGVGIGIIILNQFGMALGELASHGAEAPYLLADIGTIVLGWMALGGDVPFLNGIPVLGDVGAVGFVFLAVLMLLVAVGVEYAD